MQRQGCLFLSLLCLFVLLGCSDRGRSDRRVVEASEQTPASSVDLVTRRLWHGSDVDIQGSVSRDGLLSFTDWRAGEDGSLAVRNLATGDVRTLVKATGGMTQFAFADASVISPDGTKVAYGWSTNGGTSLKFHSLVSSETRTIYENSDSRYVQPLAWSPDNHLVLAVVSMADRSNRLVLITERDRSVRVLKTFDWRAPEGGAFSPDGRYVVYTSQPVTNSVQRDIFLLAIDGSRETAIVEHQGDDRLLGWPPSGQTVWFLSDRGGSPGVWTVDVSNGRAADQPKLVKPEMWRAVAGLGFDRAGSLFYAVQPTSRRVYMTTVDTATAKVLVPPAPISEGVDWQSSADWSADGRFVAFGTRSVSNEHRIVIRTLESGEVRELAPAMRYVQSVTWFPDGESLLARGQDDKGRNGAYRVDARTGSITAAHRRQVPGIGGFGTPTMSSDGSTIYYNADSAIWSRNLKTDLERELHRYSGNGGGPSVSPDGRQIAFSLSEAAPGEPASIWVMGTDGTNPRPVYRLPAGTASSPFRGPIVWTRDGHLLFVMHGGGKDSLWRITTNGENPTRIDIDLPSIRAFRLHPDGKRLVFDAGTPSYEVWTMEQRRSDSAAR